MPGGVVEVVAPEDAGGNGEAAMLVYGMEGVDCDALARPLAAINWFTQPTDPDDVMLLAEYGEKVLPLLIEAGTKVLFSGEAGAPRIDPQAPLQPGDGQALPVYASAEAFATMISSKAFREIAPLKASVEYESYSFVFQECVIGCDPLPADPVPPAISPPAVLAHFSVDDDPDALSTVDRDRMRSALVTAAQALAEQGYTVGFAGVSVAYPRARLDDGSESFSFGVEGIDATILIVPNDASDVGEVVQQNAFLALLAEATGTVAVQFD